MKRYCRLPLNGAKLFKKRIKRFDNRWFMRHFTDYPVYVKSTRLVFKNRMKKRGAKVSTRITHSGNKLVLWVDAVDTGTYGKGRIYTIDELVSKGGLKE